jgi:Uma2 family endonuclease
MSAAVQVPVEEYLRTTYRPDCDYVDGVIEERHLGELDHSDIQGAFVAFFRSRRDSGLRAYPELRMRVSERRYRIPDVSVTAGKPDEQVLTKPPLLCIEVLSPEDTPGRMGERVRDYLNFGVPVVWVVDPVKRSVLIHRPTGIELLKGETLHLDGTDITVPLSEIFESAS